MRTLDNKEMWSNKGNSDFYENMTVDSFLEASQKIGLYDCPDLNLVKDDVLSSKTILEVGAGFGRVINYLISEKYLGKITGIERSKKLSQYLCQHFSQQATILNSDLKEFIPLTKHRFERILWLWSGISDFPKAEQAHMLETLASLLEKKGKIILDIFTRDNPAKYSSYTKDGFYIISVEGNTLKGYIPLPEEIEEYANLAKLKITLKKPYLTTEKRKRILYVLEK